ncbi:E3 SUMO-protein ligase pli1 [Neolecta irregularis DAH-3]|uniref:E3 SUMO-protein ligase pli1 n=1 Tax=Neolecta irregularis (strain DAH-3) TaxID=1198029 RepID=A0A1U7LJ51_NEOID|nr:E3 SUMO-protein ligase pli1 [Neolecta irregularis DAH-3]|eukprot:OLL22623.1 E3 SUMO-protein ligase pli1 [Neolecta irregularis DAH-3]
MHSLLPAVSYNAGADRDYYHQTYSDQYAGQVPNAPPGIYGTEHRPAVDKPSQNTISRIQQPAPMMHSQQLPSCTIQRPCRLRILPQHPNSVTLPDRPPIEPRSGCLADKNPFSSEPATASELAIPPSNRLVEVARPSYPSPISDTASSSSVGKSSLVVSPPFSTDWQYLTRMIRVPVWSTMELFALYEGLLSQILVYPPVFNHLLLDFISRVVRQLAQNDWHQQACPLLVKAVDRTWNSPAQSAVVHRLYRQFHPFAVDPSSQIPERGQRATRFRRSSESRSPNLQMRWQPYARPAPQQASTHSPQAQLHQHFAKSTVQPPASPATLPQCIFMQNSISAPNFPTCVVDPPVELGKRKCVDCPTKYRKVEPLYIRSLGFALNPTALSLAQPSVYHFDFQNRHVRGKKVQYGLLLAAKTPEGTTLPGRSELTFARINGRPVPDCLSCGIMPYVKEGTNKLDLAILDKINSYEIAVKVYVVESSLEIQKYASDNRVSTHNSLAYIFKSSTCKGTAPAEIDVSLLDPSTQSRIQLPVRSLQCSHPECFDFTSFMSQKNQDCPLCKRRISFSELAVDELLQKLLQSIPLQTSKITLQSNGNVHFINSEPPI